MQSGSSQPGDSLDSTAKVMQEALNKASSELDKTVSILLGQLALFNLSLEKSFQSEVKLIEERLEFCLKQNLDLMMRDRDELTKRLAEHRHEEIQAIIQSGKDVRAQLQKELQDATAELSTTISGRLESLRLSLTAGPSPALQSCQSLKEEITRAYDDCCYQITAAHQKSQENITLTGESFQQRLAETMQQAQEPVISHIQAQQTRMATEGTTFVASLNNKAAELSAELEERHNTALQLVQGAAAEAGASLSGLAGSGTQFMEPLSNSFDQSMSGVTGVLYGQYDKQLRNLLAQSRTEILSTTAQAEEGLLVTRNELEITLKAYQRDYAEAMHGLLTRLEKTLDQENRERTATSSRELREGRVREQLSAVFRRIGHEILDSASQAASQLESDFQRSMEEFEKRIENAKDSASESLEREAKLMHKELNRSYTDFEKQIAELEIQLSRLEKAGRDAADIVLTIRRANLSF